MKSVEVIAHDHVELCRRRALFFVSAHVQVGDSSAIGQDGSARDNVKGKTIGLSRVKRLSKSCHSDVGMFAGVAAS